MPIHLSLIVPVFNEAQRLRGPLRAMGDFLARQPYESEIVVVDDGSSDGTLAAVCQLGETLDVAVRAVRYFPNRGKGHALKVGFAEARGERILFTDVDLSTPIEEAPRLLAALDDCPIAIGSRKAAGSRISVHQPWYREWLGRLFTYAVRIFVANVSDATCGFKAFRGEAGREIFSRLRIFDWSFDAEVLFLARRLGYRIKEVAVDWHDEAGTKVRLPQAIASSLLGLVRIRVNAVSGRYAVPCAIDVPLEVRSSHSAATRRARMATAERRG